MRGTRGARGTVTQISGAEFVQADRRLREGAARVEEERRKAGLDGMVGGLEFVIINTEPDRQKAAAAELLATTGFVCTDAQEDAQGRHIVLSAPGSADIVVQSRRGEPNPFAAANDFPRTRGLPHTRLETLVFAAHDLSRYVEVQRGRGVRFATAEIEDGEGARFIQTLPSPFTGNAIGFVEWKQGRRLYARVGSRALPLPEKPARPYLGGIQQLDHIATRVTAADRDPAILEFMALTNYRFDFAVYVENLNSITNVARLSPKDFALVFTSGIGGSGAGGGEGPTEEFVRLYGPRVHHLAFHTERIEEVTAALARDGMRYLIDLVGSPEEGLRQTFTVPSEQTMLVTEYIHRYGGFDGFFTKSNVTLLTAASGKAYAD